MTPQRRFWIVFLVVLLGGITYGSVVSVVEVSRMSLLSIHRLPFIALRTVQIVFSHAVLGVAFSLIVAFSLVIRPFDFPRASVLANQVKGIVGAVVVIGVVYGFWVAEVGPRALRLVQRWNVAAQAAAVAERQMVDERGVNDQVALDAARLYRSIVGTSPAVTKLIGDIERDIWAVTVSGERASEWSPPALRASEVSELSVGELVERATALLSEGSPYTAHYYATIALQQSSYRRSDALQLQARALNAMEEGVRAAREGEDQRFFREKLEAYQLLQRGVDDPQSLIEAYQRFEDLLQREPRDLDLKRYAAEAGRLLASIAFFVDDAINSYQLPGRSEVIFLNQRSFDVHELIRARKVVQAPAGDFFYDVEVLRWSAIHTDLPGSPADHVQHYRAPYGKKIGELLVLRAIERDHDGDSSKVRVVAPTVIRGDFPAEGLAVPLTLTTDEVVLFGEVSPMFDSMGLLELFRSQAVLERAGYRPDGAVLAIVTRLVRMGAFFALTFLSIALGWYERSRYLSGVSVIPFLVVPLVWIVLERLLRVVERITWGGGAYLVAAVSMQTAVVISGVAVVVMVVASVAILWSLKV